MPYYKATSYKLAEKHYAVVIDGIFADSGDGDPTLKRDDMPWNWGDLNAPPCRILPYGFDKEGVKEITDRFSGALCGRRLLVESLTGENAVIEVTDDNQTGETATAILMGVVQRGGSLAHWLNLVFWISADKTPAELSFATGSGPKKISLVEPHDASEVSDFIPPYPGEKNYKATERPWRTTLLNEAGSCCSAFDLLQAALDDSSTGITPDKLIGAVWLHSHPGNLDEYSVPLLERTRHTIFGGPLHILVHAVARANRASAVIDPDAVFDGICQHLWDCSVGQPGEKWGDLVWQSALLEAMRAKSKMGYPTVHCCATVAGSLEDFCRDGLSADAEKLVHELKQLFASDEFLIEVLTCYWDVALNRLQNKAVTDAIERLNPAAISGCIYLRGLASSLVSALSLTDAGDSQAPRDSSLARSYQDCVAGSRKVFPNWSESHGGIEQRVQDAVQVLSDNFYALPIGQVQAIAKQHTCRLLGNAASIESVSNPVPLVLNIPPVCLEEQNLGWVKVGILARRLDTRIDDTAWCVLTSAALEDDDQGCRLINSELVGRQTGELHYDPEGISTLSCRQELYLQQPFFKHDREVELRHVDDVSPARIIPQTSYHYDGSALPAIKYLPDVTYEFAYFRQHISGALPKALWNGSPGSLRKDLRVDSDYIQTISNYLRRVPVGRPTLQMRTKTTDAFQSPDKIPPAPSGVRLLTEDLELNRPDKRRSNKLAAYLICPKRVGRGPMQLELDICPPKTGFINWRLWVQSDQGRRFDDLIDLLGEKDFWARQEAAAHPKGVSEDKQGVLLIDPAVYEIRVKVEQVFPVRKLVPWPSYLVPSYDDPKSTPFQIADQLQKKNGFITCKISCESNDAGEISLEAGCIYHVSIIPRVRQDRWNRFGLPSPEIVGDGLELTEAATEFLVETTPCELNLPSAPAVWQALWDGADCFGDQPSQIYPLQLKIDQNPMKNEVWRWVSEGTLCFQTWRWGGIPENGSALLAGARHPPTMNVPDPDTGQEWLTAEASSYAEREDIDALVLDFPVNVAREADEGCAFTVPMGQHQTDQLPRHHRMTVELRHRYRVIFPEQPGANVIGVFDSDFGRVGWPQKTKWVRRIARGGIEKIPPPAIHMIVPLIDFEPGQKRAGFVVFLREALPSPFHELRARVTAEEYGGRTEVGIGTWAVQLKEGYSGCWPADWNARISGLTYEGEKLTPRFSHLAATFRCPVDAVPDCDLYLRADFSWQLTEGSNATVCKSESSAVWGIWLLGGFPRFRGIDLEDLTFNLRGGLPEFMDQSGRAVESSRFVPESTPEQNDKPGIELGLMFVSWKNSPIGIGLGAGRRTVGFHLLSHSGQHVSLMDDGSAQTPDAGQFLLIQARPGEWKCGADAADWVEKTLFGELPPRLSKKERGDARAVIARISHAIPFQTGIFPS